MCSVLKNYLIYSFTTIVLIYSSISHVHGILNHGHEISFPTSTSTGSPLSSFPLPFFQRGQQKPVQHEIRGLRRASSTGRKRRLQINHVPLLSTASPPIGSCKCMQYWECISNNGHVYSYCGISDSEVCCFYKQNVSKNVGVRDGLEDKMATSVEIISTTTRPTTLSTLTQNNEKTLSDRDLTKTTFLPDAVDFFYSLEDGVGNLKEITTTEETEQFATDKINYNVSSCGTQSVGWKLDSKAEFKEWPWHVALLEIKDDLYICGATLISLDLVVTASHCVYNYVKRNVPILKVRAGEYDVSTNSEPSPHVEVIVDKIFVHPNFNNATLDNDIALIKLRQPLKYADNIRPICVPEHSVKQEYPKHCVVAGWGRSTETSPFSIVMKEIVVPLWKHEECQEKLQRSFGSSYKLPSTALCAGERGHDACDGDGGGGLVCFDKTRGQFYLHGITSFGIGCGRLDSPGVYTNSSLFLNFLHSSSYLQE